jgi:Flp pilus assembly pilin Flp
MTRQIQQSIGGGRRGGSQLVVDERGLSTIEYVIILVLVAAIAIGTWSAFGQSVKCALGIANDTIGAGIGVDGQVGPQACAKGAPSPGSGHADQPGAKPEGEGEEHKHKKRVN